MGVRSEISDDVLNTGLSAANSAGRFGVIEGSAVISGGTRRSGNQFELSYEYCSQALTLGSTVTIASEAFRRVGEAGALPRTTARAFLGWNIDALGTATLNWIKQDERTGDDYSAVGFWSQQPMAARIHRRISPQGNPTR